MRQKAVIHALDKSKVPYDAIFKANKIANDNLFTYQTMLRELDSSKQQAVFLTSTRITLSHDSPNLMARANPLMDFSLLPIASGMEKIVILCVSHLTTEAGLDEEEAEIVEHAKDVCDMTAISQVLISLSTLAESI